MSRPAFSVVRFPAPLLPLQVLLMRVGLYMLFICFIVLLLSYSSLPPSAQCRREGSVVREEVGRE